MPTNSASAWGADVPISMPDPLPDAIEVQVDMDAMCFTRQGMAHNFRLPDLEAFTTPMFAPAVQGVTGGEIPGG